MKKYVLALSILLLVALAGLFLARRTPEIKHVVLISIDTCRADHFGCYGYERDTTPNIDAFAREATLFKHVVSPAPITLPAHSSMLTGKIPPAHGVHNNIGYFLAPRHDTLAELLKKNGFDTAGVVSAFVLDRRLGLAQGFDVYRDEFEARAIDTHDSERKADESTRLALDWLETSDAEKSFLFLHYYDPHDDYEPPEPFASEFKDHPYAGEIAFVDQCVGQVIEKLKELDMYDSTLLIVTGDHGEMLGEHGEDEHTYFIYESAIRVPLIVKLPGQKKNHVIDAPVGLVDLVPSICSLLEIPSPRGVQGVDISSVLKGGAPENQKRNLYSESVTPTRLGASSLMSISTGRWKYIQAPRPEIYDLRADPAEGNNLIASETQRARILEDRLKQVLERSMNQGASGTMTLDAASRRRLESLGYIAGRSDGELSFDQSKDDPKDLIDVFTPFQHARKHIRVGAYKEAETILRQLIEKRPQFHELYIQLGDIHTFAGRYDESIVNYRQAYELNPNDPAIMNNLAWLQATRPDIKNRDLNEAKRLARRLCELSNNSDPNALDTLAVTYAAMGDFPLAIQTAEKALRIATRANDITLARQLEERLDLFKQSKPFIEESVL